MTDTEALLTLRGALRLMIADSHLCHPHSRIFLLAELHRSQLLRRGFSVPSFLPEGSSEGVIAWCDEEIAKLEAADADHQ